MFSLGHKMLYVGSATLNAVSGAAMAGGARAPATRAGLRRFDADSRGLGGASERHRAGPTGDARALSLHNGGRAQRIDDRTEEPAAHRMEFHFEPLPMASVVRPAHEPEVLYVRFAAVQGQDLVVDPEAPALISRELAAATADGRPVGRAVLVGADALFQPGAETAAGRLRALEVFGNVLATLAAASVPFVWRTRAGIAEVLEPQLAQALHSAVGHLVVELGLPALDADLCFALEGHRFARPENRLRLAMALTSRGIAVRGLVDPLVPMLSDTQQALELLAEAFAAAGVHRVGARYIVLTRERATALVKRLSGMQRALVQGVFADEPWHEGDTQTGSGAPREVHKLIPGALRRAGHHRVIDSCARHGIAVDILDGVADGEDLSDHRMTRPPSASTPSGEKRRRPQLDLFGKGRA